MPMLSPRVWALHAPDRAVPCQTAIDAADLVRQGQTVVLPDYQSAIRTLILLGSSLDNALRQADIARQGPQWQASYVA